ncbi:MAG: kelch repeat-containing protein [Chitinophagaceae bacterium]
MKQVLLSLLILFTLQNSYSQNTWAQIATFYPGREGAVSFSIGNKGYIGTGSDNLNGNTYYDDFFEYDPSTMILSQKASFAGGVRSYAVGFSIDNKGYIGTGNSDNNTAKNDFWEYDPATNTWTQKANVGGSSRIQATGLSIGSKGYIGLGTTVDLINFNDFWEYNPATDVWTQKANFAGGVRFSAVGFSIEGYGYVGTGYNSSTKFKNDFWQYDPTADAWTQKASFAGTARSNAVGFSMCNKGYIGTGDDGTVRDDFWEYNPATNTWTQKADFLGSPRTYATGFSIGGKGYIGTGALSDRDRCMPDLWEYSLFSITTGSISGSPFCAGSSVSVPFTASDAFYNGNIFTAQLSDASGSFANPVNIGTLNSATSGTINATIPSYTAGGSGYRIRVISSNPYVAGINNWVDITIIARTYFYRDADLDGYGDPNNAVVGCGSPPFGYVLNNTDCDDTNPVVNPGISEICGNGIDDNCNGQIDEGCAVCSNATNLTTTNITSNSATLNWSASNNPVKWLIEYKKMIGIKGGWIKLNLSASARSVNISSLDANQIYKWHIRAKCGNKWTAFSDTIKFKTLSRQQLMSKNTLQSVELKNISTEKAAAFKLYPNPSSGQFIFELHLSNNVNTNAKIELMNIIGQIVYTKNAGITNSKLQNTVFIPSSLSAGIYMVRITVNNKTYQAKLIYEK